MTHWGFIWRLVSIILCVWALAKLVGLVMSALLFVVAVILSLLATLWHLRKKRS